MSQEQDNSAFPLHMHGDYGKGMTLRDYFAAAALQSGLIDKIDDRFLWENKDGETRYVAGKKFEKIAKLPENTKDEWREIESPFQRLAWMSYEIADAMLEARQQEA